MRHSVYNWIAALSFAMAAAGVLNHASAQPRRGPPIQFSEAKNDTVSTNLSVLTDRSRNNLKRLEEELNRPLQVLKPDSGIGGNLGMPRPPAGPLIQSKKVQELLDRQKNWALTKPEDQMKGLSDEEIMNVPQYDEEGGEPAEKSVLERYYEDLTQRDLGTTNSMSDRMTRDPDQPEGLLSEVESTDPTVNATRGELGETELNLRQLMKPETAGKGLPDLGSAQALPDLFDTRNASTWQTRGQESRVEQFKQSLQLDLPKPASPVFSGFSVGGTTLGTTIPGTAALPGAGLSASPSPRPSPVSPGASSFTSSGLSASPGLSGIRPPAPPPSPPVRQQPSLFRDVPKPRF